MNGKHIHIGTGKGWSMKGIYLFNELFQSVRNDRLTNYKFVTCWLKDKRDDFDFGEKKKQHMYPQKVIFLQQDCTIIRKNILKGN